MSMESYGLEEFFEAASVCNLRPALLLWNKEQVDSSLAYSRGVSIVWPALFKEQQAGVVTKSSYTGAIHPAEAQLTPEACFRSLSRSHARTHAGRADEHVREAKI